MRISDKGLDIIKKYEGVRLTAYKCPSGIWTIGYGHTKNVYEGMKITQAKAEEFLKDDLEVFEKKVDKYHSKYNWNQNEFDALVSFAFNVGNIDQLTANGTRSREVIASKMLEYVKGGGVVLNGLVKRRKDEKALFTTPCETGGQMSHTESHSTIRSKEVKDLQEKLQIIGYDPGSADGVNGPKTKSAVKDFQKDAGLTQDGIAGNKTWKALNEIVVYSALGQSNQPIATNFRVKEFACKDGSDIVVIHKKFVEEKLQDIRTHFGKPLTINSAYRNSSYNKKVGGSSNSYHVKGRAFDIVVKGVKPSEVARYALKIGINGIILYDTFVHVDSRPTKYYAINKSGKTTKVSSF